MIHYELRCGSDHGFDGWFKDSAAFDLQSRSGLLECPICGDTHVTRALMAPAVRKGRTPSQALPVPQTPVPAPVKPDATEGGKQVALDASHLPDQARAMLQRLRAEVERRCDYVGTSFADEARRIHRGESEARGIYGETTPEQAETLADEGIQVSRIPWIPRADG